MFMIFRERGFTLVEIVAAMVIFLVILAIVFGVYFQATKFVTRFSAKDDVLQAMNIFSSALDVYIRGASNVFKYENDHYKSWDDWNKDETLDSIAFCSMYLNEGGEPENAAVRIFMEDVKDRNGRLLGFKDILNGGKCTPLRRIVVEVKELNSSTQCMTKAEDWEGFNWLGAKKIVFKPTLTDIQNSFSYVSFDFHRYELRDGNNIVQKWPILQIKATFGVLKDIYLYNDGACDERVSGFFMDIYPYRQIFTIYGANVSK